jgi:hypothetical protein
MAEATGYTWTYVSQYRSSRDMYHGLHSSEETRLDDGYGRTLEGVRAVVAGFAESARDSHIQRLVSISVRELVPGITDVFEMPIVETYGAHGKKINSPTGNRAMSRPCFALRVALRRLHGKKVKR